MMDVSELKTYWKKAIAFLKRFSSILFFVTLGGLVIAGALVILSVILAPVDNTARPTVNPTFDNETIQRIEALDPTNISKPSGRTNPFNE